MKKLIFALSALCLIGTACRDKEPPANLADTTNLVNTKWKLAGIVDAETNVLTELEPKDCEECYTLTFESDTNYSTLSSFEHTGIYKVDYITHRICIVSFIGPELPEKSKDGELYCEAFVSAQSFSLVNNELKIFYNENKNYLLFKSQTEENYYIVGYDACSVDISDGTGKARGYVLVSENLKDTLATYNLPDNLFTFPAEFMPDNICGFNLFPEEYRFTYKVQMTYRSMTEEEKLQTFCTCPAIYPWLYFFEPIYVMIKSISKTP